MVAPAYAHMNVVVIDDDAMLLRSLEAVLNDLGFKVNAYNDSVKALEAFRETGADIVITDIRMPKCDGFEVLKQIKECDPSCEVIFITAWGQKEIAVRALREGATDFFEKPFELSALQAAIERTTKFRMLEQQRDLLAAQVSNLSELLALGSDQTVMLGQSAAMQSVAAEIIDFGNSPATVLVIGESGTGKEVVANAIHQASQRRNKPFLTINCSAIPNELFESEMFGHKRGAFTGAVETRGGYVEGANGGTLFLDEIGDLPLTSQAKILRLAEQKRYFPVGGTQEKTADVRLITATNQPLETLVEEKKFRNDLYYRLSVCVIDVPPLRERKNDIPLLALYFALQFARDLAKPIEGIEDNALARLTTHDYPGNVRELRNVIESSLIRCRHSGLLRTEDLPPRFQCRPEPASENDESWPIPTVKFEEVERLLYEEALKRSDANVSAAARILGLSRGKLRRRLEALDISSRS